MSVVRTASVLLAFSLLSACGSSDDNKQTGTVPVPAVPALPPEPVNETIVESTSPPDTVQPVAPGDPATPPVPPVATVPAEPTPPVVAPTPATPPPPVQPPARPVAGPDVILDRVDWLEPIVQSMGESDFALTSGRAVTVRALVRTTGPAMASPAVRISVTDAGGAVIASGDMTGPASIQGSVDRASIANNFIFPLKAAWIRPGMKVTITANPAGLSTDPTPSNNVSTAAPMVRPEAVMYVTAVPLTTVTEGTATLPRSGDGDAATRQAIRSTLMAMYPLSDVKVRIHAPYAITGATTMLKNWGVMLGEVNKLRIAEGRHGHYIGFVPRASSFSVTTGNAFMPGTVSIVMGASSPTAWRSGNMQHEMGHNLGLGHVACAFIGTAEELGYDRESNAIVALSTRNNTMSYCGPSWISKSNYAYVQRKLSAAAPDKPDGTVIPLSEWK